MNGRPKLAPELPATGILTVPVKKLLTGFNDLATLAPVLAAEWNHKKMAT